MEASKKQRRRKIRKRLERDIPKPDTREGELWIKNRQESPLLRLPGEIRNQIYSLVLSVGHINVRFKKWEYYQRSRNGKEFYTPVNPGGFYCRVLDERQDPWFALGEPSNIQRGMTLLSGVCRQLYQETAVLPFALNIWSFESHAVMERLVIKEDRFSKAQCRAVRAMYAETLLPVALDKAFLNIETLMLSGRTRLIRKPPEDTGEKDGAATCPHAPRFGLASWEVRSPWWPEQK
ncbi:hypothetical protein QBC47DRAFT_370755 [Echria macrotheca]|uniref:Uncharacterized protein n=1 Tax=Echria macrotheca TaxID=438768 RepID=A0AAJ0BJ55_9PEZI|nr:hypothetical protein QBC47DRAFT_370755 [Echria macrotheca]